MEKSGACKFCSQNTDKKVFITVLRYPHLLWPFYPWILWSIPNDLSIQEVQHHTVTSIALHTAGGTVPIWLRVEFYDLQLRGEEDAMSRSWLSGGFLVMRSS
jgi:hypothetical protein